MATAEAQSLGGKFLTFGLDKEDYGLEILKVREIVSSMEVTPVPRTPAHVKGVINLRGQVIPVIDLRTKFGMPAAQRTQATCVIVIETQQEDRKISTGIIVDRVCEVVNIPASSIQDPPSLKQATTPPYVRGLGQVGQSVKILLDIEHVLNSDADVLASPAAELETGGAR